eukprot:4598448-Alexandrium_andersonii.AAC.1
MVIEHRLRGVSEEALVLHQHVGDVVRPVARTGTPAVDCRRAPSSSASACPRRGWPSTPWAARPPPRTSLPRGRKPQTHRQCAGCSRGGPPNSRGPLWPPGRASVRRR